MAENFGVQGRGSFYEEVGALRDVVQNHLLQVAALLAMEPPVGPSVDELRDAKEKVFFAIDTLHRHDLVRGQFDGYRERARRRSRLRRRDVRRGPLPHRLVALGRRAVLYPGRQEPARDRAPRCGSSCTAHPSGSSSSTRTCPARPTTSGSGSSPQLQIGCGARAKTPGEAFQGHLVELGLADDDPDEMTPYERLLGDAMAGENLQFAREDGVEAAWRVVDRVLTDHDPVIPYPRNTWGPPQAEGLIRNADGWHNPTG